MKPNGEVTGRERSRRESGGPSPDGPIPADHQVRQIDHVGMMVRNVDVAERWYVEVLGAVPFERVGYDVNTTTKMRSPYRHLFVMIGDQRLELVEGPDWRGFTRPDDYAMSPHYAFAVTPEALDWYLDRFDAMGIAYQGPIVHPPMPVASVYFTDPDSNHLELSAWEGYDLDRGYTDYVRWDDLHQSTVPDRPGHLRPDQFAGQ
jgi:catechol 2,3-dioxygenase-like lactoylglutathione lyase family enzyme